MNHNETASPPLYPRARAARRLRGRPSGLKGRYRARCATGLRPALDPGASTATLTRKRCGQGGALPATPRGAQHQQSRSNPYKSSLYGSLENNLRRRVRE
jgi:hypothetical protein